MQFDLSVQHVTKQFKDFAAVEDVSFQVEKGRFFSILGPSGCGKTTLLRMIAGFTEPTRGTIEISGKDMAGLAPNKRPVNLIFQHLALFPMMNVARNVAFGLERRRESKSAIETKVAAILERVGLPNFGDKTIDQLSGGQKQRVAIARCLVLEPTVLLLDEPLGALDLKLRDQMKVELKNLQSQVGTTFVYITHDQSEALVMSDFVAVMNQGRFEQVDTPVNLYHAPNTPFVARFVGDNNNWTGNIEAVDDTHATLVTETGLRFRAKAARPMTIGETADFFVRPEAILIQPPADLSDINRLTVTVGATLFDGANSRLLARIPESGHELKIALPQNRRFDHIRPADTIEIGWDKDSGIFFPKKPEAK